MTHPKPDVREIVARFLADIQHGGLRDRDIEPTADAILSALSAAGYSVVPNEPTQEMLDAACDATFSPIMRTHEENHRLGWISMIAAAEKEGE